jgi:hypothetical protein
MFSGDLSPPSLPAEQAASTQDRNHPRGRTTAAEVQNIADFRVELAERYRQAVYHTFSKCQ